MSEQVEFRKWKSSLLMILHDSSNSAEWLSVPVVPLVISLVSVTCTSTARKLDVSRKTVGGPRNPQTTQGILKTSICILKSSQISPTFPG